VKRTFKFLLVALLILLPLNVLAVSGHMSYRYKSLGSDLELSILANVNTGTLTKYTADFALSENLTYKSIAPSEGWTATYEGNKLIATHTGVAVGTSIPALKLVFTKSSTAAWSIKTSSSQMCEGEACINIYNNQLPSTTTAGPITNPNTALNSVIGATIIASGAFVAYYIINRKKIFDNL